jgi:hypothetical protein
LPPLGDNRLTGADAPRPVLLWGHVTFHFSSTGEQVANLDRRAMYVLREGVRLITTRMLVVSLHDPRTRVTRATFSGLQIVIDLRRIDPILDEGGV